MAAGKLDILIEQGATFRHTLTYLDSDENPIDLTDYDAHMHIRKAAKGQYAGTGDIGEIQLLSVLPQEVQNLSAPLWQVNFDDDLNSRFYIDPNTGSVLRVRTDTWRLFDFMWMLHIMDYKDRSNFNTPWLIAFSGSAFLFTLTGIALLYKRFKPKKKKR